MPTELSISQEKLIYPKTKFNEHYEKRMISDFEEGWVSFINICKVLGHTDLCMDPNLLDIE